MAFGDSSSFAALSRAARRGGAEKAPPAPQGEGVLLSDGVQDDASVEDQSIKGTAADAHHEQAAGAVHEPDSLSNAPSASPSPFGKLTKPRGRPAQVDAAKASEKSEVDRIFDKLAYPAGASEPAEVDAARSYEAAPARGAASAFGSLVKPEARPTATLARRDMNAAKVLTRLVMAIVRKPGSGVPDGVKSRALAGLLRETRNAAARLGISDAIHQDRRDEAKAHLETRVLPDLVDWTRRNFMAVESMAARFSEDNDERSDRQTPRQ